MTHICLVRHGETDWNRQARVQGVTDVPLNKRGEAQAAAVGRFLADKDNRFPFHKSQNCFNEGNWEKIYSSPLSRAYHTARAISDSVGISPIHIDSRLIERNFGEAEGLNVTVRNELYRHIPIPGAETREELQERAYTALCDIRTRHQDGCVLAVAHGGFIATLLEIVSRGEIKPGNPPLQNGCLNFLSYCSSEKWWRIEWYNYLVPEIAGHELTGSRLTSR